MNIFYELWREERAKDCIDKMIDKNYWNESDLQIIEEHEKYHEDMLNYLNELKIHGPLYIELKKPSSKLPIPFKKKERLVGQKFMNI